MEAQQDREDVLVINVGVTAEENARVPAPQRDSRKDYVSGVWNTGEVDDACTSTCKMVQP